MWSWSNVESFMLHLFIDLMGGNQDNAATVFLALETQSAKTAAINAVAAAILPDQQKKLLAAILGIAKSHQAARDKIAHWTWGYAPQMPNALLLANPKDIVRKPFSLDLIYVYRRKDFEQIIAANLRVVRYAALFRPFILDRSAGPGHPQYDQLCSQPEIQERLRHQAGQAGTPP